MNTEYVFALNLPFLVHQLKTANDSSREITRKIDPATDVILRHFLQEMVVPLSAPTVVNAMDPDTEKGARLDSIVPRLNVTVADASAIENVDDLQVIVFKSSSTICRETFLDNFILEKIV